jgi:hypothetical protein
MGDSSDSYSSDSSSSGNETSQNNLNLLTSRILEIDNESLPWISDHSDCFVSQSQCNESIEEVVLYSCLFADEDNEIWDKIGQAIGNLQALKVIHSFPTEAFSHGVEGDPEILPDWERLARILRHVRQKIGIHIVDQHLRTTEETSLFARAIHGHPMITSFKDSGMFPFQSLDTLYSTLATLPALESITLSNRGLHLRAEDESTLANPESLTELLRVPALRSVSFDCVYFARALCQAASNALMKGTAVTTLDFAKCSFDEEEYHDGECATILAKGFSRNTSVTSIKVASPFDEALIGALAAALPSNSILQKLTFAVAYGDDPDLHVDWPPIFLALRENTGLRSLNVAVCESMDESLCTAIKVGLETNETLESLELNRVSLFDDNANLWCRTLSFLRTNKALKSLTIGLREDAQESCVSTLRCDIARMLEENTSLEILSILRSSGYSIKMKAEEYIALVTAFQHNTTLKTLLFQEDERLQLNDDESKQISSVLKKNYALEMLPDIFHQGGDPVGDVGVILRLNKAGRRYLIEDGSSISKGVEVLSRVDNDTNCMLLHLLENPRLCDRKAVEMVSAEECNDTPTNPTASSGGGKREQVSVPKGRESRRRLA